MTEPVVTPTGETDALIAGNKLVHLECARGIASVIVIFNHFCVAFIPAFKTTFFSGGLKFTPFYFVINGNGAVIFFFLLSGFVLTQGFFRNPSPIMLTRSIIKRLPRLMLPVSVTIFAGFLILNYGFDQYKSAAEISNSRWLHGFGNAPFPAGFNPSIYSAIQQVLYVFIFQNYAYYNTNLWTMRDEFLGSLLVFAISALYLNQRLRKSGMMIHVHCVLIIAAFLMHSAFIPFLVGSGLAYLIAVNKLAFSLSNRCTIGLLIASAMAFSVDTLPVIGILPAVAGSLLVMLALLGSAPLAQNLSGRIGSLLGTLSFPLYLVHTLIIVSLSSSLFVYLTASGLSYAGVISATFVFTLAAAAFFSIPLVYLESFWVPWLNAFVKNLVAPGASPLLGLIGVKSQKG